MKMTMMKLMERLLMEKEILAQIVDVYTGTAIAAASVCCWCSHFGPVHAFNIVCLSAGLVISGLHATSAIRGMMANVYR